MFAGAEPYVTYGLIAINVLIFFVEQATGRLNGNVFAPSVAAGDWWVLLTSGFLHASIPHVGINMFLLYRMGPNFEKLLGPFRFILLYVGSLLCGSLAVIVAGLFGPDNAARGASGAIFGLFGALVILYQSRGISLQQSGLLPILLINAVFSFLPGISLAGHLGGFIGGLIAGAVAFQWDDELKKINKHAITIALGGLAVLWFAMAVVLA